jgi:hypothetical protein
LQRGFRLEVRVLLRTTVRFRGSTVSAPRLQRSHINLRYYISVSPDDTRDNSDMEKEVRFPEGRAGDAVTRSEQIRIRLGFRGVPSFPSVLK